MEMVIISVRSIIQEKRKTHSGYPEWVLCVFEKKRLILCVLI